jgi:hypothetical protein
MRYARPSITTLDAPSIIESIGPAQAGYAGGITTPSDSMGRGASLNDSKR